MTYKDCLGHFLGYCVLNCTRPDLCDNFIDRSEWVHLPDDEYTFMVRGDIAKTLILANCRAADAERALGEGGK